MKKILVYFYDKYKGVWEDIYNAICEKEQVEVSEAERVLKEYEKDYDIITVLDEDYPENLKREYKPPFILLTKKGEC